VNANSFEVVFIADQGRLRQVLNAIVTADQFFIIRNLNIENSKLEGPKRVADAADSQPPSADGSPAAPASTMRLLVGRETLTTALRIEMITFNTPPATK
jgi:hypothetical protein